MEIERQEQSKDEEDTKKEKRAKKSEKREKDGKKVAWGILDATDCQEMCSI